MLKADAGYTGYVNQMGDVSEVNSVEKILGEVTKLKAQASALITRLNKAYEQNNSPEIFRLQAQLPPVLGQLEREYRSLSFRAEAANPIESNDSLCNRMDEVIGDYLTAGEFDHSTKAAHFSTLSSMAKELSFPLHPIDDASCAGTVRDVHIITKLERERNTPPQTETAP